MLAVESKWTGRSVPTTESILWNLVRPELTAHHEKARCIFLLAGTASMLAKVFEDSAFSDAATKPHRRPVLRHRNNVVLSIPLVPLVPMRFKMMSRMLETYREFRFPE